jgi:hypothetical protein
MRFELTSILLITPLPFATHYPMLSASGARLFRFSKVARFGAKSFSDATASKIAPKVVAPVTPVAPVQTAAASGGSTLVQRLSSCLVGMAIGYRLVNDETLINEKQ